MLPHLKRKESSIAGLIIKNRQPDQKPEEMEGSEKDSSIKEHAQALIDAVHSKNVQGVEDALRSAFEVLDSEPHEEGPHTNDSSNSFDAQNALAASLSK